MTKRELEWGSFVFFMEDNNINQNKSIFIISVNHDLEYGAEKYICELNNDNMKKIQQNGCTYNDNFSDINIRNWKNIKKKTKR